MNSSPPASRTTDLDRSVGLVLLGVAALLAIAAHLRITTSVIDDAWITWRYSANLAAGHGLVYNPGEAVLGTSTPAWAILLGAVGAVTGVDSIPTAARILNLLLLLAGAAVAVRFARTLGASRVVAGAAGAVWLLAPYQLFSSVGGMETPLFALASVATLQLLATGRLRAAAVIAGISVWVRMEGVFLIALAALEAVQPMLGSRDGDAARRATPTLLQVIGISILPGIVMVGWMMVSYGLPWPHSVEAKRAGLYDLTVAQSFTLVRAGLPASFTLGRELSFFGLGPLPVLFAGCLIALRRSSRFLLPALLLTVLVAFYSISRTLPFPHYFALFEPWALLAWGAAAWACVLPAMRKLESDPSKAARKATTWAALFVVVQPVLFYPWFSVAAGAPTNRDAAYPSPLFRTVYYEVAAEQIEPALAPGTRIVLPEIGVLGWEFADQVIVDAAGLVSPEALEFLPVPDSLRVARDVGAIPPGLVRDGGADLVLTLDLFGRAGLFRQPWFQDEWEVVWAWSDPNLAWGPLRAFARKGSDVGARLRELPLGIRGPASPTP